MAAARLIIGVLFVSVSALAQADDAQKPNRIERTAKKTGDAVDRTVKRSADWTERTAKKTGKAVGNAADRTDQWVRKKLE